MMEAVINREEFAEGLAMMFHGMGKVFESLGCPEGTKLESMGGKPEDMKPDGKDKPEKKPEAPKNPPARKAKEKPPEEPKAEPGPPKEEPVKKGDAAPKEETAKKGDAAPMITFEMVANALSKRSNRAKAEGDETFNERLRGILDDMGYKKVSDMPTDRYEEFMALLSFM